MNTKVVRQLTPTESTPLKKFKADLTSSSSSSSSPIPASQQIKARTPIVIRRSQQQQQPPPPVITEAAESPIEFREIKVPPSNPTQSSAISLSLVFEPSPESTQVHTTDSQSTIPFISTGITPEEELPPMDPAKIELVQNWLDRCEEPEDVVTLSSDDEEESTAHQTTGKNSPEESQEIPQGSVTPKRNNPAAVAGSTGKQTAITAFFTPRSSATVIDSTVEDRPNIRIPSNVNIRELNMDGPLSASSSSDSTINQQEEVRRNGRAEWSSLMSRMRGGASGGTTVRRGFARNNSREEQGTAEPRGILNLIEILYLIIIYFYFIFRRTEMSFLSSNSWNGIRRRCLQLWKN